ncbi:MAG: BMC domain-containing protein [Deltaproteobacteria bacterium]|nr:BMC domain-containing protein [Deltaproteobacteria bacterium]
MAFRSIGLIELNSVAQGILVADEMLKAADVELIMARPACPGRYLAMVAGDVGAVQSAVDVGRDTGADLVVDSFVIPAVHSAVFPALSAATSLVHMGSLGVIETYTAASAIMAADAAVKAAEVVLIEVRCSTGLAGKSYLTLTGDVGSVRAAVDAGVDSIRDTGLVLAQVVIAAPSPELVPCLI